MQYTLTITTESVDEIFATISNLKSPATVMVGSEHQETIEATSPVKKTRKAKSVETAPAEVIAHPHYEDEKQPSEKVVSIVDKNIAEVSYDEVKTSTLALIKAKGKQAALELLDTFGVPAATALKTEQFGEYVEAAKLAAVRV